MNKVRRILAIFLALALVITMVPQAAVTAFASETETQGSETAAETETETAVETETAAETEQATETETEAETPKETEETAETEETETAREPETDLSERYEEETEAEADREARAEGNYTYKKVDSTVNGGEYLVVYDKKTALEWNGSSYKGYSVNVSNNTISIPASDANKLSWTLRNGTTYNNYYSKNFLMNYWNGYRYENYYIYVNNNNQMRTSNGYYAAYSGGKWNFNESSNSNFTFYQKVTTVTQNYYVNGTVRESTDPVSVTNKSNFPLSRPDAYSQKNGYNLNRVMVNKYIDYSSYYYVYIDGDTTIDWYFTKEENIKLSAEFYLNGTLLPESSKEVQTPSNITYTFTRPNSISKNANLTRKLVNGTEASVTNEANALGIKSSTDAKIQFYYTQMDKDAGTADDKLYEDDNEGTEQYPKYPQQGSVKVGKDANSEDFNGSGIAQVELGVTGVPVKKGVDVVLILDVSNSMNSNGRLTNMKAAAKNFAEILFADNSDGSRSNNRLGIVTFAEPKDNASSVQFKLKNANAMGDILKKIETLTTGVGTDYDLAFREAADVMANADANREQYVIFMTDGAPSQFTNKKGTSYSWYDYPNKETFAKGISDNPYLKGAEELKKKAKVYCVGLGLKKSASNGFNTTQQQTVVKNISTDANKYYYSVEDSDGASSDDLNKAFSSIAMAIRKAGNDAVITDTIGNNFTLQTAKITSVKPGSPYTNVSPSIELKLYDVYTRAEVGKVIDGKEITLNDVGKRKGTYTTLEKVTFNDAGTTAVSDLLPDSGNIYKNGKIQAEYFTYDSATKTFVCEIGDITEKEAALSYYVYLKGAMEGKATSGLHDTNESANLTYTNYLGTKNCRKEYPVPKMPWGSALVTYEYYLVNSKGEPVNAAGVVVPISFRVTVGQSYEEKFLWNGETAEGSINAASKVPEGYTLYDGNQSYYVKASSSGPGTYSTTGSGTYVYKMDTQCVNTGVAFAVLYEPKLNPDAVVLDYGKKVTIDVTENDMVLGAVLDSVADSAANIHGTDLGTGSDENALSGDFEKTASVNLNNGSVKIALAEGKKVAEYTPTKYMDSIDEFLYSSAVEAAAEGGTKTFYKYQKVQVIPATTVYYEDNFGTEGNTDPSKGIVFSDQWETVKDQPGEDYQDNGTVSDDQHPYGYDTGYAGDSKDSGGSSHKLTVNYGDGYDKESGEAVVSGTFKFKGTGFDLIGRTDTTTCTIGLEVYDKDNNLVKDSDGNEIMPAVDGYYSMGSLYQIPVLKIHDLSYDEYTVKISVYGTNKTGSNTFYLDAVRIYDPLGNSLTDNEDFEEASKKYNTDKESNAEIIEIRNIILDQADWSNLNPDDKNDPEPELNGGVFVDVKGETPKISDYLFYGPNNELYLAPGQSIAFDLRTDVAPAAVQIGVKAPEGKEAVCIIGSNDNMEKQIRIKSASDMYYDVSNYINMSDRDGRIVLTNADSSGGILSFTNLKITYPNNYEPNTQAYVYVNNDTAANALSVTASRAGRGIEGPVTSYTVTFKNGAQTVDVQTVNAGESAKAPTLSKTGYTLGWDKEFSNVNSDLTVNAVWSAVKYTVTFRDGGKVLKTQNVEYGKAAAAPSVGKTGYTLSWSRDFSKVTENLTVDAVWTAKNYQVSFNGNKGTVKGSSLPVTFGSRYGTLPAAVRKGYVFKGWFTSAAGGTLINADSIYADAGNKTLYAGWTKVSVGKASLKKATALKGRKMSVMIKSVKGADGYTIQYSTSKKFTKKTTKSVNVKANKKSKLTQVIKKLKIKKTYYVKVRAYKFDSANAKVYGKYSGIKRVIIKK